MRSCASFKSAISFRKQACACQKLGSGLCIPIFGDQRAGLAIFEDQRAGLGIVKSGRLTNCYNSAGAISFV